jgi:PAS domain S-box-containing protein
MRWFVISNPEVGVGERLQAPSDATRLASSLLKALSSPAPSWRYVAAFLIFLAAVLVRMALDKELPPGLPFLTFFPAILANTYLAGLAVGIATLLASALTASAWWLKPPSATSLDDAAALAVIAFLVVGAVNILIVHLLREERERSGALAKSTEEAELQLKTALNAANLATWEYNLETGQIVWDGALRELFGLPQGQHPSIDFFFSIVHPEDRSRLEVQRQRALAGDASALASEFRVVLTDGTMRWIKIEGAFLSGVQVRAAGVARDITRRRLADERMLLVTSELKHRMRNLFAVVGSIFQQTLRSAGAPDEIGAAVSGRLSALARAQDLLTLGGGDSGADLAELVRKVISPLVPEGDHAPPERRLTLAGPTVVLPPDLSSAFALVLHELATNALKYGAWSGAGAVHVSWRFEDPGHELYFFWQEVDGPPIATPVREGLGTTLIQKALPAARVEHSLKPTGLECSIRVPLEGCD